MSKKNFVTIALSINVIICVILCVLYFNGYGERDKTDTNTFENTRDMANSNIQKDNTDNQKNTTESETTKEINTTREQDVTKEIETTKEQDMTKEIETTKELYTTGNVDILQESDMTEEPETTTINPNEPEETTTPAFVNGKTTAVISSACNVRDSANVSSHVIGVTRTGEEYIINTEKCDNDWIAIVYNGTIGYISTGYCTLK